jgi:hypothetical protein
VIIDHVGAAGGGAGRVARVAASDHVVVDGCGGRSGENGLTWVETSIPTIRSIARGGRTSAWVRCRSTWATRRDSVRTGDFHPNTVVITPSEVRDSLTGVSADGWTYTFSSDSIPWVSWRRGR